VATKSIYKNVRIKDKGLGRRLVIALENAQKHKGKEVTLSKTLTEVKGETIRQIFGDK
jgi:hypothetical protein